MGRHPAEAAEAVPREGGTVEFGWEDDRKLSGRRRKVSKNQKAKPGSFETMGLSESVLRGIKRKGYRLPTPIQRKTIPLIVQGLDVVGMARTGSGKTAAFVIPMLDRLKAHASGSGIRGVILSPTRELSLQTNKVVTELGRYSNLRTACLVGGDSMEAQFAELAAFPDIVVATPGRLMHHLKEIEGFSLNSVTYAVFDEADRLFEMGFAEQLKEILGRMPTSRQTLLFSATMPKALAQFARAGLKSPELVRLDADTKLSPDLQSFYFTIRHEDKPAGLLFLVEELIPRGQPTVVFVATRHSVEFLVGLLAEEGIESAFVHGTMDQMARKINIGKFRAGKVGLLIVTDVAARGLDIPLLDNVINYDFPAKPKLFVHRAGRVARAGRPGSAYSFLTRDEIPYALDLHLFLSRSLLPAPVRGIGEAAEAAAAIDPGTSLLGAFPQTALDMYVERVRTVIGDAHALEGLQRPFQNAFKLYVKTRAPAVPESVKRARLLPREGMHPILAAALPSTALGGLEAQTGLAQLTSALKNYRPSQTVLEAEVAAPRRAESGGGATAIPGIAPSDRLVEVMREKRAAHNYVIQARKRERELEGNAVELATDSAEAVRKSLVLTMRREEDEEAAANKYRDQGFYVSAVAGEGPRDESFYQAAEASRFDDAVLDLTGEDAGGMRSQKLQYYWDKRGKKYVRLQSSESTKAGKRIKSKGGSKKGSDEPSGLYKKWASKNKMQISAGQEGDHTEALAKQLQQRFKRGGRGWVNPLKANADDETLAGREEIKRPEQVRRERKVEEQRKERFRKQREVNDRRTSKTKGGGIGKKRGKPSTGKGPGHKSKLAAMRKPGGKKGRR